MSQRPVRAVLFARTDRLGETVLNLPAAAALQSAYPQASFTWLAHPDLVDLLARVPGIAVWPDAPSAWPWWRRAAALAGRIRAGAFDVAVISNPRKDLHAAAWLAGVPVRVGWRRKWGGLLTRALKDRKALGAQHEVQYNLDLVALAGAPVVPVRWPALMLEPETASVRRQLAAQGVQDGDRLIALHPWTSNPRKQWPRDRFAALARALAGSAGVRVAVIGGPAERREPPLAPEDARVIDLTGALTLPALAALLRRARLLISNDSGPVHLAAAVGTKTLVLFGTAEAATAPQRWGPWGEGHAVLQRPAIEAITVEEVLAALPREALAA